MARGSIRVPIRGQRLPRLTENGRPLSNKDISKNINNWINDVFEEELRLTAFLDVNTRRQIRLATGVGDIAAYVKQFNNGFAETSQLSTSTNKSTRKEAFGEPWANRPRLRKISLEGRIVFRPKRK